MNLPPFCIFSSSHVNDDNAVYLDANVLLNNTLLYPATICHYFGATWPPLKRVFDDNLYHFSVPSRHYHLGELTLLKDATTSIINIPCKASFLLQALAGRINGYISVAAIVDIIVSYSIGINAFVQTNMQHGSWYITSPLVRHASLLKIILDNAVTFYDVYYKKLEKFANLTLSYSKKDDVKKRLLESWFKGAGVCYLDWINENCIFPFESFKEEGGGRKNKRLQTRIPIQKNKFMKTGQRS